MFLHLFIPLVPLLFSFDSVIIGKNNILTSSNSLDVQTDGLNMTDVLEFLAFSYHVPSFPFPLPDEYKYFVALNFPI